MPSTSSAALRASLSRLPQAPAPAGEAQLAQASRALWLATLSLMTAFMQNPAPAHRLQLARRISRNFETLAAGGSFSADCRASFARLARRWHDQAEQLSPQGEARRGRSLLRALFAGVR